MSITLGAPLKQPPTCNSFARITSNIHLVDAHTHKLDWRALMPETSINKVPNNRNRGNSISCLPRWELYTVIDINYYKYLSGAGVVGRIDWIMTDWWAIPLSWEILGGKCNGNVTRCQAYLSERDWFDPWIWKLLHKVLLLFALNWTANGFHSSTEYIKVMNAININSRQQL